MPRPEIEWWRWIALALAALVPRVVGAILRQPWHDEYFTAWASKLPLADLLAALRLDSGPPLPYLLVKLLATSGLEPVTAARTISVAAGTAGVLLAAQAARRAFGARAGWWTGAFLAVHPLAVAWSCEGRAYSLMLLAVAWAWERLGAAATSRQGALGLAAAVALACWCHGLGLLLAVVLAAAALTLRPPDRTRALTAVGAGLASHLAWLPVAVHQPPAAVAWMAEAWRAMAPLDRLHAPVRLLSPLGAFASALDLPSSPVAIEVLAALALAAAAVAGCLTRGALLPAVGVVLPTVVLGGLATAGVPAFYPGRGEVLALPPLALLVGAAAGRLRVARLAVLVLTCGAAVTVVRAEARWVQAPPGGEERIADALRRAMPAGGTVAVSGLWGLDLRAALRKDVDRFRVLDYPMETSHHPGWADPHAPPGPGELSQLQAELGRVPSRAVVVAPGLATSDDLRRLARAFDLADTVEVPGGTLCLPRRLPDAGRRR